MYCVATRAKKQSDNTKIAFKTNYCLQLMKRKYNNILCCTTAKRQPPDNTKIADR